MAVEVVPDPVDYNKLAADLEAQELESPGGVASAPIYSQLLLVYLIQNDLPNSKCLWKRIPHTMIAANPELARIWSIGQALWQRDFALIYEQFREDWSDDVKQFIDALEQSTRQRAFMLVSNGYSSISVSQFAGMLGLAESDAIAMAIKGGWHYDEVSLMVHPKKSDNLRSCGIATGHHLSQLTDFVAFLEN